MNKVQIKTCFYFVMINVIIFFIAKPVQAVISEDEFENDDNYFAANYLDQVQYHNIHQINDVDWVKFYAVENTAYTITASQLERYCDISLVLYNFYEQDTFLYKANKGGDGENETLTFTCARNSLYHLKIEPSKPYVYGKETFYCISLTNSKNYDVFESDDTINKAKSLVVNADFPQIHSLHNNNDSDLFKFYAQSINKYTIKIINFNIHCKFIIENSKTGDIEHINDGKTIEIINTEGLIYLKISSFNNLCNHSTYSIRADILSGVPNDLVVYGCIMDICSKKTINNAIIISDSYHDPKSATTDSGYFEFIDHEKTTEPVLFRVNVDPMNSIEKYLNYQLNLVVDQRIINITIYLISNIEHLIENLKQLSGINPEQENYFPLKLEHIICRMKSLSGETKPYHKVTYD
ncbi:hypothetical protein MHK_001004 [Candidatus Magnetomorum sp. HK-1]|nr:hypothetical protein MHK_001004 [Candidatus Magnetomorum sp. HK-1]